MVLLGSTMEIWYKSIIAIQAIAFWIFMKRHGYFKRNGNFPPHVKRKK
jgi:hypothetical protein